MKRAIKPIVGVYNQLPSYGMTGTQKGATDPQLETLKYLMIEDQGLLFADGFYWHFGDCIGADAQAFTLVSIEFSLIAVTVAHPGHLPDKRAYCQADEIRDPMENEARNMRIAYLSFKGLFALPREYNEIRRSGTWTTVRDAGKLKRPTWIIRPDGSYIFYPEGYTTELSLRTEDETGYPLKIKEVTEEFSRRMWEE